MLAIASQQNDPSGGSGGQPPNVQGQNLRSRCTPCYNAHVSCGGGNPCSRCQRTGDHCHFESRGRSGPKGKVVDEDGYSVSKSARQNRAAVRRRQETRTQNQQQHQHQHQQQPYQPQPPPQQQQQQYALHEPQHQLQQPVPGPSSGHGFPQYTGRQDLINHHGGISAQFNQFFSQGDPGSSGRNQFARGNHPDFWTNPISSARNEPLSGDEEDNLDWLNALRRSNNGPGQG